MSPANLWSVAKHVGRYGHKGGDIIGTGHLKVFRPGEEPEDTGFYATVWVGGSREAANAYIQQQHSLTTILGRRKWT